jgi:hypothetical protein
VTFLTVDEFAEDGLGDRAQDLINRVKELAERYPDDRHDDRRNARTAFAIRRPPAFSKSRGAFLFQISIDEDETRLSVAKKANPEARLRASGYMSSSRMMLSQ